LNLFFTSQFDVFGEGKISLEHFFREFGCSFEIQIGDGILDSLRAVDVSSFSVSSGLIGIDGFDRLWVSDSGSFLDHLGSRPASFSLSLSMRFSISFVVDSVKMPMFLILMTRSGLIL
jgi:hypothetical protein